MNIRDPKISPNLLDNIMFLVPIERIQEFNVKLTFQTCSYFKGKYFFKGHRNKNVMSKDRKNVWGLQFVINFTG